MIFVDCLQYRDLAEGPNSGDDEGEVNIHIFPDNVALNVVVLALLLCKSNSCVFL
jgi:hypothetical protein